MRLPDAAHAGERAPHGVELAVDVERLGRRPRAAHDVEVLVGAPVAGRLVEEVAVAGLLLVAAAGDDVHRQATARELVERGQLAGRHRRRHEARAMGEQHAEALGRLQHPRRHDEAVRGEGEVADQHPVEAGVLVRPGEADGEVGIDDRTVGGMISEYSCGAIIPMNSTGMPVSFVAATPP